MSENRKIAAILVADVVGYSRLAGADEEGTLARLRALRGDLIDPAIAAHRGRIVKRTGDGSLIEFRSVVDAVRCAIEVQNGMLERNAGLAPERRIEFRIGIHLGDVVEESDGDLMGDGVNVAAPTASLVAGFYLDNIADVVEREIDPLYLGLRFAALSLLVNLAVLALTLTLFTGGVRRLLRPEWLSARAGIFRTGGHAPSAASTSR